MVALANALYRLPALRSLDISGEWRPGGHAGHPHPSLPIHPTDRVRPATLPSITAENWVRLLNVVGLASRLSRHERLASVVAVNCLVSGKDSFLVRRLLPPACEFRC